MKRITFCKPAKAKQTGPNRSKMIRNEKAVSRNILEQKTPQDLFQQNYDLRQQIRLVLGK
jgi:hypothetical protein